MDGIEEDDGYSDDDLDALPVHDFHELQQDAIRSTQQPRVLEQGQRPYVSHESVVNNRPRGSGKSSVNANGNSYSHQPSSDYGDFDDEMLDGEIFDAADQPSILPHGRDTLVLDDEEPWMQDGHGELVANARLQSVHRTPVGQSRTQAQAFEYNGGQAHLAAVVAPKQSYRPDIPARLSSDAQALQAKIDEVGSRLIILM